MSHYGMFLSCVAGHTMLQVMNWKFSYIWGEGEEKKIQIWGNRASEFQSSRVCAQNINNPNNHFAIYKSERNNLLWKWGVPSEMNQYFIDFYGVINDWFMIAILINFSVCVRKTHFKRAIKLLALILKRSNQTKVSSESERSQNPQVRDSVLSTLMRTRIPIIRLYSRITKEYAQVKRLMICSCCQEEICNNKGRWWVISQWKKTEKVLHSLWSIL